MHAEKEAEGIRKGMQILESDLFMSSSRAYVEHDQEEHSLRVWAGREPARRFPSSEKVTISPDARSLCRGCGKGLQADEAADGMDRENFLRKLITEILLGAEVKTARVARAAKSDPGGSAGEASRDSSRNQGWGMEYRSEQLHREREEVSFRASGVIRTADGKEVGFSLNLDMNREYVEKNSLSIRAGDAAIDPLVINFDGNAAALSPMRFEFDLDSDGNFEEVPIPTAGRGFLAIDLNGDGIVTNGLELFGPATGNGFRELGAYDADKNSWIDENDEVFESLRVMTVDSLGIQSLGNLKDFGIGAISLQTVPTLFDLREIPSNELLGRVQHTGLYLREDATPGTIQQLDLVV